MYIPIPPRAPTDIPTSTAGSPHYGPKSQVPETAPQWHRRPLYHFLREVATSIIAHFSTITAPRDSPDLLRKRDLQSQNVTIGAVVGVLLGLFIIGTVYFCVRYHRSIRFADRKKRRHHRSTGGSSRGSKASTSSGSTAPAPPAPPAPPPAAEGA